MSFLTSIFTWWRGATIGTRLFTWRQGHLVGSDKHGNRYYQTADGKRRWVIYSGTVDASFVPPDWHGWMHHTLKEPPTVVPVPTRAWERDHQPNLTGTPLAYRPRGSLAATGERPAATGDYEAWQPE